MKEKDAATYARLVEERRLDPARTWMIGNSPKSDINPALAAGLNAVYIPHDRTWHLERTELAERLRKTAANRPLRDLRDYF